MSKRKDLTKTHYDPRHLRVAVDSITMGTHKLDIPKHPRDVELNDSNRLAYAILYHNALDLLPREISFLGTVSGTNYLTDKQRKWLGDLAKRYLDIDIDANA